MKEITVYCSGASGGITDLMALIQLGMLIGVEINRLSGNVRSIVVDYARAGSRVFVDSGAFWAFKRGVKINFDVVLDIYDQLIFLTRGNLAVVAPDVIGDQQETFELLALHKDRLLQFIGAGAEVLVPLHRGRLDPYDAYKKAVEILGNDIVVAIPSNKKAFSNEELIELLGRGGKPKKIHFLGITPVNKRWAPKEKIVSVFAPDAIISMDGCFLRSIVGNQQVVDKMNQKSDKLAEDGLQGAGDLADFEDTEYLPWLLENIQGIGDLSCFDEHLSLLVEDLNNGQLEIDDFADDPALYAKLWDLGKSNAVKAARPIARGKYIVDEMENWLRKRISSLHHDIPIQVPLPI